MHFNSHPTNHIVSQNLQCGLSVGWFTSFFMFFCRCTSFQEAPVAVLTDSTPYNSTYLNNKSSDITDLSCNKHLMKSSHESNQKSSKSKQMRLHKDRKNYVSVKHTKQDAFQLSQRSVKKRDKKKKKGRKTVRSNSPATLTPSPQTHTIKQRTSLKNKLKKRTSKARVTPKSVSATKSLLIGKTSNSPSVTKSDLKRKKNKKKSHGRNSKKFTTKFHSSRGDHYQQKHHRDKNTSNR